MSAPQPEASHHSGAARLKAPSGIHAASTFESKGHGLSSDAPPEIERFVKARTNAPKVNNIDLPGRHSPCDKRSTAVRNAHLDSRDFVK